MTISDNSELTDGVITAIRKQSKRKDRVSLFVDEEFALGVCTSVWLNSGLRKGDTVTAHQLRSLSEDEVLAVARSKALNFLSYRPRTLREISDRLVKYGYEESIRDSVVEWLRDRGYVDDRAFAEQFAEERSLRKGYGPRRVAADLARKGIDRETSNSVLDKLQVYAPEEIAPAAVAKAAQRWARLRNEEDPQKRKSKLVQYLQRRGFQYSVAVEILERVMIADDE